MNKENTPLIRVIKDQREIINSIINEISQVIIGQNSLINKMLIGLLTGGHILLEGVPGLAKTLAINTLAKTINADFSRIQFTPDMLPADIIGTTIYNQNTHSFSVKKGAIFANFVLADEINRAPSKVQSALLEAMQEKQVTIGDHTFPLPTPFMVMATQNPLEQEGTYPLSEAQTDRFFLKAIVDYPTFEEERIIVRQNFDIKPKIQQIISTSQIETLKEIVKIIYIDEKVETYLLNIIFASRNPEKYGLSSLSKYIHIGASPRASISVAGSAKAIAFLNERDYVIPDDVKSSVPDIIRHRIGLTYEALAENVSVADIINEILEKIEMP
jgi:MoxR-like ATPase